jgi:hypothetical protein
MWIKDGKKLKKGDSVRFTGGKKHRREREDWAASEGLEVGELYIVGRPDKEDGYFVIKGKMLWHHPSRFELVEP